MMEGGSLQGPETDFLLPKPELTGSFESFGVVSETSPRVTRTAEFYFVCMIACQRMCCCCRWHFDTFSFFHAGAEDDQ